VIEFPNVTKVDEADVDELADRLFVALDERARSESTRTFEANEGFGGAYG
jgi:hypothetical protein